MTDYISRKALLDELLTRFGVDMAYYGEDLQFVQDVIQGMPGVGWIPVTERLPEPFVSVLVQMPGETPSPTVREGHISKDGIWYSAFYHREPGEVTHWQPMPEPPKEGE